MNPNPNRIQSHCGNIWWHNVSYSISYWFHTLPLWRLEFICDATLRYIVYITCVRVRVDPQPNSISPSRIREIAYCSSSHNSFHVIFLVNLTPSGPIDQLGSLWSIESSPFVMASFWTQHPMLNVSPPAATLSVKWWPRSPNKCPRFGTVCRGSQRNAYPILAHVQPVVTCSTSLEPALAVLDSGPRNKKPLQMVKTKLTKDFQFGQFGPTVSVALEPSCETSHRWWTGAMWHLSEISVGWWTFCHQHQLSRSNGAG